MVSGLALLDDPTDVATGGFRRAFPRVAAFIDGSYQPEATIGGDRVLAPRASGAG